MAVMHCSDIISIEQLDSIESKLSTDEKIALIFLTADDDVQSALNESLNIILTQEAENHASVQINSQTSNYFRQWAETNRCGDWQTKFIEALYIAQANHILNELKSNKIGTEMILNEMEKKRNDPDYSIQVHKYYKILYLVVDELENPKAKRLIESIHDEFYDTTKINGRSHCVYKEYLEVHLLEWIIEKIIDLSHPVNIRPLMKFRSILESDEAVRLLERLSKPGYILIINQIDFDNKDGQQKLDSRDSSNKDVELLLDVFSSRGFIDKVETNVPSNKIIQLIGEVAKKSSNYDSLVVCILSHGINGYVFGSDSNIVSLDEIKKAMAIENLKHIPKLLIIQACQNIVSGVTNAAITPNRASNHYELNILSATIPGLPAFRDKDNGSVFIHALHRAIKEKNDYCSLSDVYTKLCAIVVKSLKGKQKEMCTSLTQDGTCIKFYFPKCRQKQT